MEALCPPLKALPTPVLEFRVEWQLSAPTSRFHPRGDKSQGTRSQLTHRPNPPLSAIFAPSQPMKHRGPLSLRAYQSGGPTVQNSFPLVMVRTPVPPTRQLRITAPRAPCLVLPLVHWVGLDPVPPHPPIHHPALHSKYSNVFLSLLTQAKVLPPPPSPPHCPHKQSGQIPLRRWPYVPTSRTIPPGHSPPGRALLL